MASVALVGSTPLTASLWCTCRTSSHHWLSPAGRSHSLSSPPASWSRGSSSVCSGGSSLSSTETSKVLPLTIPTGDDNYDKRFLDSCELFQKSWNGCRPCLRSDSATIANLLHAIYGLAFEEGKCISNLMALHYQQIEPMPNSGSYKRNQLSDKLF